MKNFTRKDGLIAEDLVHCGLDHLTASKTLFQKDPIYYDSAGYLAHIGVELLLKGWLLATAGKFAGIHKLKALYQELSDKFDAPLLKQQHKEILKILDEYESLRYPNRNNSTEVGDDDWEDIESLIEFFCRSMPKDIQSALSNNINKNEKSGRILMRKKVI